MKQRCNFEKCNILVPTISPHRMKSEHNIQQPEPKLSEVMSSLHLSKKGAENKDPIEAGRKPPLQPGGSRLPVLAKSLKLQVPPVFKESHSKWEEKLLAVSSSIQHVFILVIIVVLIIIFFSCRVKQRGRHPLGLYRLTSRSGEPQGEELRTLNF